MVCMTGNDLSKEQDFWSGVGKKIGISMMAEVSEQIAAISDIEQFNLEMNMTFKGCC